MALKNRKTRKYRGSRTCGGGNAKMRRGAGHRGGRGNAGAFKHHKSWYMRYDPSYFIHKGPGRPDVPRVILRAVNIGALEEKLDAYISSGLAERKDNKVHIDLSKIGFDKLLGSGVTKNAWVITAKCSSQIASRKISEAGGELRTEAVAPEDRSS